MSNKSYLVLLLDGPMQSWGFLSRFQRRTTAPYPTKSGVIGILAAAMGIDKYGPNERDMIASLANLKMTTVMLPRKVNEKELEFCRMMDYHTVEGTKTAEGKKLNNAVLTYREYLLDARFGILLHGDSSLIEQAAKAIQNPQWGIWFGRKCCVPASPLFVASTGSYEAAWSTLLERSGLSPKLILEDFKRIEEVDQFDKGIDMISDMPTTFSIPNSHAQRRISIHHKNTNLNQ